jgi:hypothetical protein
MLVPLSSSYGSSQVAAASPALHETRCQATPSELGQSTLAAGSTYTPLGKQSLATPEQMPGTNPPSMCSLLCGMQHNPLRNNRLAGPAAASIARP